MLFLSNNSRPHLDLYDLIVEPLNVLRPLVQIGLLEIKNAYGSTQTVNFWGKQENFIVNDLKKCNKTAWLLPDYKAQQMSRTLIRLEKHSDVGINSYFKLKLNIYLKGAVSGHLILKDSSIHASGLLDWWSNLINRTDLVRNKENRPPPKPTMSGNIQIIFLLLAIGLSIAQILMIVELHGFVTRAGKAIYCWLCYSLQYLAQKFKT